jgi:CRP-like cAMP-binding protein
VFDGVPPEEIEGTLDVLHRRRFPAGSTVIAQGDTADELYVVEAGVADVFVAGRGGMEHRVGSVHAGGTLGEMSLFTGLPAAGTVRASTDLDVLVVDSSEFDRIATEFPVVYRNLGAILSERLARTNRLATHEGSGRVVLLRDWGGAPLHVYALAASIAWHTRGSTILVVVADDPAVETLASLLGEDGRAETIRRAGAHVRMCSASALAATVRGDGRCVRLHSHPPARGCALAARRRSRGAPGRRAWAGARGRGALHARARRGREHAG